MESQATPESPRPCLWKCGEYSRRCLYLRLPILSWLPSYQWREDFPFDLLAGVMVTFVCVPQSMAFALLANCHPVLGLYTACFPVLVYTLLGTATYSSFGCVAITSIIIGEIIGERSNLYNPDNRFFPHDIAVAITFIVGVVYVIAFFLQLGVMSIVFTKPFINGAVSGCMIHVMIKNLRLLLGIKPRVFYGVFNFYKNFLSTISALPETKILTCTISAVVMLMLILNLFLIRPQLAKVTRCVLPMEGVALILMTLVSYVFDLEGKEVDVVGNVPSGFPAISVPSMEVAYEVMLDGVGVALINYATTTFMSILFNQDRPVDFNQELLAIGTADLLCCSLQCISLGNSLVRTAIAVELGVRSLLASTIAALAMLAVILFAGPLFGPLPQCVLGCVIQFGALVLFVRQCRQVYSMVAASPADGVTYGVALLGVLAVNVQVGLCVGMLFALRTILAQTPSGQRFPNVYRPAVNTIATVQPQA